MRPNFGVVKDIDVIVFGFGRSHDLDTESPSGCITALNGVPHIFRVIVWLLPSSLLGVGARHGLDSLIGDEMEFDVNERVVLRVRFDHTTRLTSFVSL